MKTLSLLRTSQVIIYTAFLLGFYLLTACSSDNTSQTSTPASASAETSAPAASDKGVGPVATLTLNDAIDPALADQGKAIFESKCAACHKFGERYVGPSLSGVTERRKPEWIMNMVLNPQEMTEKDPIAKELLGDYMTQMPNQNMTEDDARAMLEYFRSLDHK